MTPGMQRMNTIALLIAAVLLIIFLVLHNKPAKAQAQVNCQLVTVAYPKMQISMVSKECWIIPAAIVNPPLPRAKPCKMKGRVRYENGCFLPRRHKLMHGRK